MSEYEQSVVVEAPPERVFAFLADPTTMPQYLPFRQVAPVGPEEVRVVGAGDAQTDSRGWLRADPDQRRVEWGAESRHAPRPV